MTIRFSTMEAFEDLDKSSFDDIMGQNGVGLGENGRGELEKMSLWWYFAAKKSFDNYFYPY